MIKPETGRRLFTLATFLWLLLLITVSLQPARPRAGAGLHREFHFVAFAFTALLLSRTAGELFNIPHPSTHSSLAALATIALGAAIEILQHLIYRNPLEWWDIRDDAVAAAAALLLAHTARAIRAVTRPS